MLRAAPRRSRPYLQLARIDRPIGWQLLLLPCLWSATLAADTARSLPQVGHLALFLVGAVAMRGAGSTFNDIVDRDIDRKVARTRGRPVASGRVSPKSAVLFLIGQALVGALVLFSLNRFSIGLGLASLLLVAVYPFAKRVTHWPQAVLGSAFAWGGLMGWAAFYGTLAPPALLIYAAAFFWTVGYDTIYALQDIEDDAIVGIGSTALLFGPNVRVGVALLYLASFAAVLAACIASGVGWIAYASAALFGAHLAWQVARIRREDGPLALRLFRSNWPAGLILFVGLLLDSVLRTGG